MTSGSVDAVHSSHTLEQRLRHDVPTVLAEFLRVLRPGGPLLIACPDLQAVAALVAD